MFVDDIISRADNWVDSEIPLAEKVRVINEIEDNFYSKTFLSTKKTLLLKG